MNLNNTKVLSIIESTFNSVISQLVSDDSGNSHSDLFVQVDAESGELQIYDEAENLIERKVVFDWVDQTDDEAFHEQIVAAFRAALSTLVAKDAFEKSCFSKPFSVSLTDEEFTVLDELLFLDDDTFRLDDPLLKDLDTDLDHFLTDLLSDLN